MSEVTAKLGALVVAICFAGFVIYDNAANVMTALLIILVVGGALGTALYFILQKADKGIYK
jgi:hypothetical protein